MRMCGYFKCDVKQMFGPGLAPTIMEKSTKRSTTAKRSSYRPRSSSTLTWKTPTLKACVGALCPRTPQLTQRSVCDFSRAQGRPETCAFQAMKCPRTFCWWMIMLCSRSGYAGSARKHARSMVSRIHPRPCSTRASSTAWQSTSCTTFIWRLHLL